MTANPSGGGEGNARGGGMRQMKLAEMRAVKAEQKQKLKRITEERKLKTLKLIKIEHRSADDANCIEVDLNDDPTITTSPHVPTTEAPTPAEVV